MLINGRILADVFFAAALASCLIVVVVEGLTNTGLTSFGKPNNCTSQSSRCCKLGRKAARHHSISPIYTCYYEALIAGLDHQTSVANRLRASKGRLRQMKNIARVTAFRHRLAFCYKGRHKQCFETCCIAKRRRIRKLKKIQQKPTTRSR